MATVDNSLLTHEGLSQHPYDPFETPSSVPAGSISVYPHRAIVVSHHWLPVVNGLLDRILWRDAWEGTNEEQQSAANDSIQLVDKFQKSADVLYRVPFSWPSENVIEGNDYYTILYGSYVVGDHIFKEALYTAGQYVIWLQIPHEMLLYRLEVDSVWSAVVPGATSGFFIENNLGYSNFQPLPFSGNQTLVWQATGSTMLEQLKDGNKWKFVQRLDVNNPSLPYAINWSAIRLFGYYVPSLA